MVRIAGTRAFDPVINVCNHDLLINIIQQIVIVSLIKPGVSAQCLATLDVNVNQPVGSSWIAASEQRDRVVAIIKQGPQSLLLRFIEH
jgi:hypothetical protein